MSRVVRFLAEENKSNDTLKANFFEVWGFQWAWQSAQPKIQLVVRSWDDNLHVVYWVIIFKLVYRNVHSKKKIISKYWRRISKYKSHTSSWSSTFNIQIIVLQHSVYAMLELAQNFTNNFFWNTRHAVLLWLFFFCGKIMFKGFRQ